MGFNADQLPVCTTAGDTHPHLHVSVDVPPQLIRLLEITLECCDADVSGGMRRGHLIQAFWAEQKAMLGEIVQRVTQDIARNVERMKHGL